MIEEFIENDIKSLTKEEAVLLTLSEKDSVNNKLKNKGYDILSKEQQPSLNGEGLTLRDFYHDLDWLSHIITGEKIVYVDRIKLHDKLKTILSKEGLI